jgi:hypothetical protein
MDRELTGPNRHRSPLDPPRLRTGPPRPVSADPTATPASTTRATTTRLTTKAFTDNPSPQLFAAREG